MTTPREDAHRYDHDGMHRHHHDADSGDVIWWERADQFGGDFREHRHDQTTPREDAIAALLHATTDATTWADQFLRLYPDGCKDADTMLGWFANAIEVGRMAGAAALGAEAETPATASSNYTIRASLDEGEAMVREMEVNALEQKLNGQLVDLASPETAEALARAAKRCGWFCDDDEHKSAVYEGRQCYCEKVAAAILAAMRETGR